MPTTAQDFWPIRTDKWFAPVLPVEAKRHDQFVRLGSLTERYLRRHGADGIACVIDPFRGDLFAHALERGLTLPYGQRLPACPRLAARWQSWSAEYATILARHPHIALREVLSEISECYDASSWPYTHEDDLRAWADSGDYEHPPPPGHWGAFHTTPRRLFDKMVALRREARGWWRYDPELEAPVWCPDHA
ncbi:MAG TPA: hypothetical protein VD978_09825 [Azospirillum sp.]|nr:hypothetical protein [Azospirillum sp.]